MTFLNNEGTSPFPELDSDHGDLLLGSLLELWGHVEVTMKYPYLEQNEIKKI
jgi:hypothetical protein